MWQSCILWHYQAFWILSTNIFRNATARSAQRDPPRLVLEVGGGLQLSRQPCLESWSPPPTWNLEVGGTSTLQAQLPARLKSPPLQAQVWGGSRWADLAVYPSMSKGWTIRVSEVRFISGVSGLLSSVRAARGSALIVTSCPHVIYNHPTKWAADQPSNTLGWRGFKGVDIDI